MNHFKWGPVVILGLFFSFSNLQSKEIHLSIFDTGFCLEKLPARKNIIYSKVIDHSKQFDFKKNCEKLNIKNRKIHGHWVLKNFLDHYSGNHQIKVQPHIIFDQFGHQKWQYWVEALKQKSDLLILAVGYPFQKSNEHELKQVTFVASGGQGGLVKSTQKFWPQESNAESVILIGSYLENEPGLPPLYDSKLLYKNQIDYYFDGGNVLTPLNGSSHSVGIAAGLALSKCPEINKIKNCLKKIRKKQPFFQLKKEAWTF